MRSLPNMAPSLSPPCLQATAVVSDPLLGLAGWRPWLSI
jgi:hypothetical protein